MRLTRGHYTWPGGIINYYWPGGNTLGQGTLRICQGALHLARAHYTWPLSRARGVAVSAAAALGRGRGSSAGPVSASSMQQTKDLLPIIWKTKPMVRSLRPEQAIPRQSH